MTLSQKVVSTLSSDEQVVLDALPTGIALPVIAEEATAPLLLDVPSLVVLARIQAAQSDATPAEIASALVAKGLIAPADQRDVQRGVERERRRVEQGLRRAQQQEARAVQ